MSYLPDVACGLTVLGEREEANGQVWHLPAAEALTMGQFLALVFEHPGRPPKFAAVGRAMQRLIGMVNPMVREFQETFYQRERRS